jgi:hypothetical protein
MLRKKRWEELTALQRTAIVFLGVLQVMLMLVALLDIRRRPPHEIRGSKRMWRLLAFVNFIGPMAYFLFGRRDRG